MEHQKVKNDQKLKCTKNALLIYQIVDLGELMRINTTRWCDFGIGCPENMKNKKLKCPKIDPA